MTDPMPSAPLKRNLAELLRAGAATPPMTEPQRKPVQKIEMSIRLGVEADRQLEKSDGIININNVRSDAELEALVEYLVNSQQTISELHIVTNSEVARQLDKELSYEGSNGDSSTTKKIEELSPQNQKAPSLTDTGLTCLGKLTDLRVLSIPDTGADLNFLDAIDRLAIVELDISGTPLAGKEESLFYYYLHNINLCEIIGVNVEGDIYNVAIARYKERTALAQEIHGKVGEDCWAAATEFYMDRADIAEIAPSLKHFVTYLNLRSASNFDAFIGMLEDPMKQAQDFTFVADPCDTHPESRERDLTEERYTGGDDVGEARNVA